MIKTFAVGLLGAALGCAATLAGTRAGIESAAAAATHFPAVDTKGDRTLVASRLAHALCKHEAQSGGIVTLTADSPVVAVAASGSPGPKGLVRFELRATCSGGPEGSLESGATVPSNSQ